MAPSTIPLRRASIERLKEALLEANRDVIKWAEEELQAIADGNLDRLGKAENQLQEAKLKRYFVFEGR
jgi:hypothetical protein